MKHKIITGLIAIVAIVLTTASSASAHVTVNPDSAKQGGYTKLTFRVPNEKPDVTTTRVEVNIPVDQPIASVRVQPQPGWTYVSEKSTVEKPIKTDDGSISETTSKIIWTADANSALKPGEFGEFNISVGPLPTTNAVTFKVLQTYSNGDVVRWIDIQTGTEEPEHPAPTLRLTAATADEHAQVASVTKKDVDNARVLGIAGLVVGIVALLLAQATLILRKKP